MTELTWILDPTSGDLTVEGLSAPDAERLAADLLPPPRSIDCARPLTASVPPTDPQTSGTTLRVARLYHGSVVEGPGRRSVVQVQGCPIRCPLCSVPWTHEPTAGVVLLVDHIVEAVLDPVGLPRDGISLLGGEPFAQPDGLVALLRALKDRDQHVVVYSGYTLESLARRPEPAVREALRLTNILIDGPFVAALAEGAGEWRGSRNQRVIADPGLVLEERSNRCR